MLAEQYYSVYFLFSKLINTIIQCADAGMARRHSLLSGVVSLLSFRSVKVRDVDWNAQSSLLWVVRVAYFNAIITLLIIRRVSYLFFF